MHRLRLQHERTCCRTTSKFSKHLINNKLNTCILPSHPSLTRRIDFSTQDQLHAGHPFSQGQDQLQHPRPTQTTDLSRRLNRRFVDQMTSKIQTKHQQCAIKCAHNASFAQCHNSARGAPFWLVLNLILMLNRYHHRRGVALFPIRAFGTKQKVLLEHILDALIVTHLCQDALFALPRVIGIGIDTMKLTTTWFPRSATLWTMRSARASSTRRRGERRTGATTVTPTMAPALRAPAPTPCRPSRVRSRRSSSAGPRSMRRSAS